MGQRIVGQKDSLAGGCLQLLGLLLVGATLCALIVWINWPR